MRNVDVNVHHVTRVEGHGNIVLNVRKGKIEKLRFDVVEAPRFFEAMLRGRRYDEACHITCRICGICSTAHSFASLCGMEAALGIEPSEQTVILRKLALCGEQIQSHVLHVGFLVLPDLFRVSSIIPLASTHPDLVKHALRAKKLGNTITEVITGRHIHGLSAALNGFTKLPTEQELRGLLDEMEETWPSYEAIVSLLAENRLPDFDRETEYLSIRHEEEYAFYRGDLVSNDQPEPTPSANYRGRIKEHVEEHSSGKHASSNRDDYMVGALSRFNNNYDQLHEEYRVVRIPTLRYYHKL